MYIRMYDELKRSEGDNPTIGIVLCSDTDDDIARYSVMHGNEQLFASKYKLYLPTKEELKAEIETQKAMFYLQQQDSEEQNIEQNLCRIVKDAQMIFHNKHDIQLSCLDWYDHSVSEKYHKNRPDIRRELCQGRRIKKN